MVSDTVFTPRSVIGASAHAAAPGPPTAPAMAPMMRAWAPSAPRVISV
ncbi:MAG: hypothetical protein ACI9ZH_000054 [Paracoccaceae bacterium]|jgi:hypothetical protein